MITSQIKPLGGVPTLFLNGKPLPEVAYITYLTDRNAYADFGKAGYRLFSCGVYFGDQPINETSGIRPFYEALFPAPGQTNFQAFDREMQRLLDAVPEALFFPRVMLSPPRWWEVANPDECNDFGVCPGRRRFCFSSQKWRADAADMLRRFIAHIEAAPYRDHVIGYQLAAGGTEEWFGLDTLGSTGPALRKAFREKVPEEEQSLQRYRKFVSEAAADTIAYFCRVTKEATQNRLVTGAFYGYIYYIFDWWRNHNAIRELLQEPALDFICSPVSYCHRISHPEKDWPWMVPLESIKEHGKLYFVELDIRTCRTLPLNQSRPNACPTNIYEGGLWKGPDTMFDSIHVLRANFCRQLCNGHASWWFDMWGQWFADPEIMAEMAKFRTIATEDLALQDRTPAAEWAVFLDEDSLTVSEAMLNTRALCSNLFEFGQNGTPFVQYEIEEFPAVYQRYKGVVILMPYPTDRAKHAIALCEEKGIPHKVLRPITGQNTFTPEELRAWCRSIGIHVWCDSGDAIHANKNYVAIHAATAGEKTIHLPGCFTAVPLLDDGPATTGDTIIITLQKCETRLWRLLPTKK